MDELTKKQKGFVKDYLETGNGTQSALRNYNTKDENTANQIAIENLRKPTIQNAIKSIADSIPEELIIEKHLALLNKEEVVTKNNMTTGEVDVIPTGQIDVQAVSKGLDMVYKLKGSYAPDKAINLNIETKITDPRALELAREYEEKLKKNL